MELNWTSSTVYKFYFPNISRVFPYYGTVQNCGNLFLQYFQKLSILWKKSNVSSVIVAFKFKANYLRDVKVH